MIREPSHLRSERGSVLVFFALLLPALLLVLGFAVDVGNWFTHHRHLQMQADAAALAGGAYFGDCFDPSNAANANTTIEDKATQYAGNASSAYNPQVGGGAARVTTLFNSKTFAAGGPGPDDTETNGPCQTPHLMLDVKQTEQNVPYILGGLIDLATGTVGVHVVPAINARARVQLKTATILSGMLPLAVPDVNPKSVAVTFVNEASGVPLGTFPLTKGSSSAGMNMWSGDAPITLPAIPPSGSTKDGVRIGARISVGGVNGNCASGVQAGVGFVCYDWSNTDQGLVAIRDYPTRTGTLTSPVIQAVWAISRASCSLGTGSPFFSDVTLAGAASCPMDVFARVSAGASYASGTLKATINGVTRTLVAPSTAGGDWTTPGAQPFSIGAEAGPFNVDLNWSCPSGCGNRGIDFPAVQRVYSANDTSSGPVKWVDLSEAGVRVYSATPGAHTITVQIGLKGSLDLSTSAQTTALRLTGGSRTTAIDCDGGSGANDWKNAIINGCKGPYQTNGSGLCPDPSPPAGPPDCIPIEPGKMANTAAGALNTRFASCPPNNWPTSSPTDPRTVKLMITDFSALDGSGKTEVPIIRFAAFYITGWDGATCGNNQPWPFAGSSDKGDIWGHFVKYVAPDPFGGGTEVCDPLSLSPCIPVLVK